MSAVRSRPAGLDAAGVRDLAARRMSEKALQESVRVIAQTAGYELYHTHDSRHSGAGLPDVLAYRWATDGLRLIVAELKRVGKVPTEAQEAWLEVFRGLSANVWFTYEYRPVEVYVWTPLDLASGAIHRAFGLEVG